LIRVTVEDYGTTYAYEDADIDWYNAVPPGPGVGLKRPAGTVVEIDGTIEDIPWHQADTVSATIEMFEDDDHGHPDRVEEFEAVVATPELTGEMAGMRTIRAVLASNRNVLRRHQESA